VATVLLRKLFWCHTV